MKYFAYCRKSTDESNRQVQSIQAQETELNQFAQKEGLEIVEIFRESKTAKQPGREIFNKMLMQIEQGKAEGILAWHPDRLARNSVDGGKVIFMMDQGLIKDLKFPTYWVDTSPQGKFTLSLAFGQSKYYIDNLSQNVKRGQREKLRRGEWPTMAILGYKNDLVNKKIIPDPKTFPLIKRLFDEYAKGRYSLREISEEAYKWGLKSKLGIKLTKSTVQRTLSNPFYMGIMVYGGKKYKGTHMKAINTGKFLQVQKVMKNRGKPTKNKEKKNFPFTGLIKCAECGCSITAEEHKGHVYYRCTKKKGTCNQKYVRTEVIEKQVEEILSQIAVDEDIFKLMILALKATQDNDFDVHQNSLDFWRKEYDRLEAKKRRLLDLITDAKISESEFEEKRNEIDCEQSNVEDNLTEIKKAGNQWIEQQKNLAINCYNAFLVFSKGDDTDKKLILHNVGSNFLLSDGNISWDWIEPFDVMAKNTSRSNWRRGRDSNSRVTLPRHSFRDCCLKPLGYLSKKLSSKSFRSP